MSETESKQMIPMTREQLTHYINTTDREFSITVLTDAESGPGMKSPVTPVRFFSEKAVSVTPSAHHTGSGEFHYE